MSEPTYELLDGGSAIRCRICDLTSHNPNDVAQRYCGHCKLFHESGVEVLLDERVPLAPAPNFGASWPAQRERVLARLAKYNPDHPWVKEEQLRQAEAEAAALRRLIIAYRNIGMRLATPQTQQWHEILQEAKLAERALYAAVEQPGAGQALLAELAAATEAAAHFFHCRECCEAGPCAEGLQHAERLGLMT